MRLVTRSEWGAPASSPAAWVGAVRGVKVHYLGAPYSSRAHAGCAEQVRRVRAAHLAHPTEGYVDIAYNFAVCEHGYVFEGRGLNRRSGANGSAALNARDYAVLALLGSSGLTEPTPSMLEGLVDAIDHCRANGGAGGWVGGHRDGHATACPGEPLYRWVRAGARRPTKTPEKEADMPLTNAEIERIAERVWKKDQLPTLDGEDTWTAATYVRASLKVIKRLEDKVDRLTAEVAELKSAAAQREG